MRPAYYALGGDPDHFHVLTDAFQHRCAGLECDRCGRIPLSRFPDYVDLDPLQPGSDAFNLAVGLTRSMVLVAPIDAVRQIGGVPSCSKRLDVIVDGAIVDHLAAWTVDPAAPAVRGGRQSKYWYCSSCSSRSYFPIGPHYFLEGQELPSPPFCSAHGMIIVNDRQASTIKGRYTAKLTKVGMQSTPLDGFPVHLADAPPEYDFPGPKLSDDGW